MPLPKIEEARSLSNEAIAEEILAMKRKLFELRLEQATRRLEQTHEFKHTRHRLAQLMTVERERQLTDSQDSSSEQPETEDAPVATSDSEQPETEDTAVAPSDDVSSEASTTPDEGE